MHSFTRGNSAHFEDDSSAVNLSAVCDTNNVDPTCLRTYYGTLGYTPKAVDKVKVALSNYLGESSNRSDARIYLEMYRPDAVAGMF